MAAPIPLGIGDDGSRLHVCAGEDEMWTWCQARAGGAALNLPAVRDCARENLPPVSQQPHLGVATFDDAKMNDLTRTGWAVLYGAQVSADIKAALQGLIAFRRGLVGSDEMCPVFGDENHPYTPGQSASDWLSGLKLESNAQVPRHSPVPYYVMIVASPEDIPFEFQFELDVYWGVGRLWLGDNPKAYAAYGDAVIANETTRQTAVKKELRFFAPRFDGDQATELVNDDLVKKLVDGGIVDDYGFTASVTTGADATKQALLDLYGLKQDRPAIYFVASHGLLCKSTANLDYLTRTMGAIMTQPWNPANAPTEDTFVASRHLKAIDLSGTFHILCACFGAGWPRVSSYDQAVLSPSAMVAYLPQKLLANGALAVLGHIDRAWSYSYVSDTGKDGIDRTQEYEGILAAMMTSGWRVGYSTDKFNIRWKALGDNIAELERSQSYDSAEQLHNLWVERDDARGYVLLGDPAVKLNLSA